MHLILECVARNAKQRFEVFDLLLTKEEAEALAREARTSAAQGSGMASAVHTAAGPAASIATTSSALTQACPWHVPGSAADRSTTLPTSCLKAAG